MGDQTAAIVGAGNIGRVHATAYREAGARVVAVCDVDERRAAALATEVGATAYTSVERMLDAGPFSVVSVCTPPSGHQVVAEAVARRGIALLCEKPLAHSVAAAEAIVAAVAAGGAPCMTGFCHRFHPPVLAIKEQLAAGAIGAPIFFRNRFAGRFGGVEQTWFADPALSGGGALMDTSVHSVDLYRYLIGEITEVAARLSTGQPGLAGARVEHSGVLLVGGPTGVPGVIEASWVTPAGGSVLVVYGTEGTLSVDYGAGDFGVAYVQRADDPAPRELPLRGPSRFTAEIGYLLECVASGRAPSPDAHDGLRAVQVLMAAYAAAGGATATLPPPPHA